VDSDLEVAQARLGRRVGGRWLLERVLGTGGMGAVYAARAPDGAVAAVKILHPEMGARRDVRERFLREGWAAESINHSGVVRMVGQGDGEEAFLAMELLEGETLRDRVRRHGRLPLDEVLDFADQVLAVLVAAHDKGIVHRDLKPDNLFVTLDGRIKVLDFGLARLLEGVPGRQQTRTGVALGTLAYMAPEQALGRRAEIDGRVDVFALGATMFRVLAGRHVHEADSEAELLMAMASRPAPPLNALVPELPFGVAAVIDLALAFARDARYPDARTMQSDVQALRRGLEPRYATERLASRSERTRADGAAASVPAASLGPVTVPTPARTVPLAAFTERTAPYPAGGAGPSSREPTAIGVAVPAAPPSMRAPLSTRTEPLAAVPPGAYGAAPIASEPAFVPSAPPQPAGGTSQPLSPGMGAVPALPAQRKRRVLPWVLALAGVASACGVAAYFALSKASAPSAASSAMLPAPLPNAAVASAPRTSPEPTTQPAATVTDTTAPAHVAHVAGAHGKTSSAAPTSSSRALESTPTAPSSVPAAAAASATTQGSAAFAPSPPSAAPVPAPPAAPPTAAPTPPSSSAPAPVGPGRFKHRRPH